MTKEGADGTMQHEWFALTTSNEAINLLEYADHIAEEESTHVISIHDFQPELVPLLSVKYNQNKTISFDIKSSESEDEFYRPSLTDPATKPLMPFEDPRQYFELNLRTRGGRQRHTAICYT